MGDESHHRVSVLGDQLARETAMREASDIARRLEMKKFFEQLENDLNRKHAETQELLGHLEGMSKVQHQKWHVEVNELWRVFHTEKQGRRNMVQNLKGLKKTTNLIAQALEKVIAKTAASSAEVKAGFQECAALKVHTEEIAVQLQNFIAKEQAQHSLLRGEHYNDPTCEATCEISELVWNAEARLSTFITEKCSSCEEDVSRFLQTYDHVSTSLHEESEEWQVVEQHRLSTTAGIEYELQSFKSALEEGMQHMNGFEAHLKSQCADEYARFQAKCLKLCNSTQESAVADLNYEHDVAVAELQQHCADFGRARKADCSHTCPSDQEQNKKLPITYHEMVETLSGQQRKLSEQFNETLTHDLEPRVRLLEFDLQRIKEYFSLCPQFSCIQSLANKSRPAALK